MIGTTVAHYTIKDKLGEGGMGEVYRARDTKLNRDVALKILPQVFARDAQRMARFEREAQVLASLNHANIAQIYGLEEADGTKALVLELVEGETLAERTARGLIPVDEALKIALQICEGLEAAHEKGIIHRDLKPANIKVTPEGQVKLLDFGLAKALEGETPVSDLSHSPTLTQQSTQAGMILGTAAYMSPEQARGDKADRRSDIWSFGSVLFETLAGRKPFEGTGVADVLASVLKVDPDWTHLPKSVPRETVALLRRCLNRDPAERLQAIGEARLTLQQSLLKSRPAFLIDVFSGARTLWWVAPVLMILLAGGWWLTERGGLFRHESGESVEQRLLLPAQLTANPIDLSVTGAAISPDGNYLAYTDPEGLHLQLVSTGESHLVQIDEVIQPWKVWWYPDGTQLLLLAKKGDENLSLWTVGMLGGRAVRLQDSVMTAAISPDGRHIAFIRGASTRDKMLREIWLADADGKNPGLLLTAGPEESFWNLGWSPDSQRLAYGTWENYASDGEPSVSIKTCDLEGRSRAELLTGTELFQGWTGPLPFVWAPDGRLVFAGRERPGGNPDLQTSNLWAIGTNLADGSTVGEPRRLTQWVASNVRGLSVSADGTRLVVFLVRNQADVLVGKLDPAGGSLTEERRLTANEKMDDFPSWRPDSRALAFGSSRAGSSNLYTIGLDPAKPAPLLIAPGPQIQPVYSPDGEWVLFLSKGSLMRVSSRGGIPQTVTDKQPFDRVKCAAGSQEQPRCLAGFIAGTQYVFHSFTPDGEGSQELFRISHRAPFTKWALSRDGTRIAVVHNDDNRIRLFSVPFGTETQIEVNSWTNFEFVEWSADGQRLYLNAGFASAGQFPSLLMVDLEGNAQMLRKRAFEWHVQPAASPDGNYLAFVSMPFHGNAWLIRDF